MVVNAGTDKQSQESRNNSVNKLALEKIICIGKTRFGINHARAGNHDQAKNQEDQITFALAKLDAAIKDDSRALIMLEYSDNVGQVTQFMEKIQNLYPMAAIALQPLSLTSGAHMGPGTWGVAFLKTG